MYYATKLRMNYGYRYSQNPEDIDQIFIYGYGWQKKGNLHDYLKQNPKSIAVNIHPYAPLIPAISSKQEKYVRSNPNPNKHDNLMDLPKE